ncbi:MAG TPA: TetR/AcrR family transcriptional regulator [Chroococcales cyanobacterium]|jgi:AcrR family transcriptional regulator
MDNSVQRTAHTRARILKAATEVFAASGIAGATTREIARVAGVNEVTLFRHFQSKEQLLAAVVQQVTALQAEALANQDEWTGDLQIDLLHYAWIYNNMLEGHEALVRMFIGEAKRHPEAALQVLRETVQPLRDKLIAYLRNGIDRGNVRPDVDILPAVDMFTGMLLAGMLRSNTIPLPRGYSRDRYIESCVGLFVRGISTSSLNTTPISIAHSTLDDKD